MSGPQDIGLVCVLCAVVGVFADAASVRCSVRDARQASDTALRFALPRARADVGGGFAATGTLRAVTLGQRADVTITDVTGTEREVVVELQVSLPGKFTHVFVSDGRGPQKLGDSGRATYRGPLSLPAVTFYGPDAGVTVAAPFEVRAPTLTFLWRRTEGGLDMTVMVTHLRLPARGEAKAGMLVGRHEGCWRPGLGWLVTLYPEWFHPPNPKVYDYDGPMIYTFVTSEQRLRRDLAQDLVWQELGWYWPHLGLYKPDADTWRHQPRSEGGYGKGGAVSVKMLNDYITLSNRLGVAQCLYFQSTESWAEYAEKHFPESRVRRANGSLCPTWVKCVAMNPDADGAFGKHILDQARRLVAAFPGMAGVFWDQNCYTGFDYAHDDGISMVGGRRVSMMEFAQHRILALGSKFLHDHGKVIFTNGGWTAGLARYCDGHMSEGTRPTRRIQYLCMFKHLTLLCYDGNLQRGKEKVKLALETGAQPSVTLGDDACRAFFARYRPIFRMLRRKQWVFHPKALALPDGIRGNIFRTTEGNHLVTAVAADRTPPSPVEQEQSIPIRVRLPDAAEVGQVLAWRPELRGYQVAETERRADGFGITLPRPDPCGAAILARRGRWVAVATARLIAGRRQSVGVLLANLEPTPWTGEWRVTVAGHTQRHASPIPPGGSHTISLGPLDVPRDAATLTIEVHGPGPDGKVTDTILDVPVVPAVGVRVGQAGIAQLLRGESVSYAIANRVAEPMAVSIKVVWKGPSTIEQSAEVALKPGEARPMAAKADVARAGLWHVTIQAKWPDGETSAALKVDVVDVTLPKDFRIEDAAGMSLKMDIFNSLGKQWADKPVTVNGITAGRLPITGSTLRWHEGMVIEIPADVARRMLAKGRQKDGSLVLHPSAANTVKNCFKIRNVQAAIRTRTGETFLSTWTREVQCTGASWLYSEGACVRFGQPVPLGALRFLRKP